MSNNYYATKEQVDQYIKMAEGIDGTKLIEKFTPNLPKGAKLLELGSGPGKDWKILSNQYPTTGSDNSFVFLDYLQKTYPEGRFLHLDAVSLNTDELFDGIYSNKVLHHLSREQLEQSVVRQSEILTSKGVVFHSFWRGSGMETYDGMDVYYYEVEDLHKLFSPYFHVVSLGLYKEFDQDDSLWILAKKR